MRKSFFLSLEHVFCAKVVNELDILEKSHGDIEVAGDDAITIEIQFVDDRHKDVGIAEL